MTIDAPVQAGQRVTFVFRVRHDGPDAAPIRLGGQGEDPRADVVWRLGRQDVTDDLDGGSLRIVVPAGAHRDLTLSVTLPRGAAQGATLTRTLTAEALDGGARDRIRAVVTQGPSPVRFHDVGLALGLPRHTHSFDLDAARVDADGIDDLVMSTHGRVDVLLNHQPGLATVQTWSAGDLHACAVGDADGDLRSDVYCTVGAENGTASKRNRLWLQQPDGSFGPNRAEQYGVDDPFGRGRHPTFVDLDHRPGIDLFVGNENPRSDDNRSVNRTFLNADTTGFVDARLGMRSDIGGLCAQAADQDGDGWDDLLVCGGAGPATVGWNRERSPTAAPQRASTACTVERERVLSDHQVSARVSTIAIPRPASAEDGALTLRGRVPEPPSVTEICSPCLATFQLTRMSPSGSGWAWRTELATSSEITTRASSTTSPRMPASTSQVLSF